MLRIVPKGKGGIRTFQGSDIVFGNIDVSIYAQGCKFGCKHCHSKQCNDSKEYDFISHNDILRLCTKIVGAKEVSIVGLGGDFGFQMSEWIWFCQMIKDFEQTSKTIKTILYTGFFNPEEMMLYYDWLSYYHLKTTDAILWGRWDGVSNNIVKDVTIDHDMHKTPIKKIYLPLEMQE